ncbi:MAG: TetR family transcriptional regulator [Anaerolineae bacterium]|jgi:AcrR family transcriptional regulator|nr:TetR family transcriptional regulator [Anaerolineae bacterium]
MPASRREQYTEATRRALLESARRLFGTVGYAATTLDDIAHDEGLTKGAVYHHFKNKEVMFGAVIRQVLSEALQTVSAKAAGISDPRQRALAAIDDFLDICLQAEYQQIVLRDGPAVLGWVAWKALEKEYSYPLIEAMVTGLMDAGLMEPHSVDLLVRLIVAWLIEVAFLLTETNNAPETREQAKRFLTDLLKLSV